jgi:ABC-2 type transport system ATP-binding protein
VIELRGIEKRFPGREAPALASIDLTVPDGTVLGLVGRNGAGKSTLLRIAAGLAVPNRGGVALDGHDLSKDRIAGLRTLGWVPERPRFAPEDRPRALLTHLARLDGLGREAAGERAAALLERTGLAELADRPIGPFSTGEQKRLALAIAWLGAPKNLLYDEVTGGLDAEGRRRWEESFAALRAARGAAVLASHRFEEIERWSDRVAVLDRGRLVATVEAETMARGPRRHQIRVDRPSEADLARLRARGAVTLEGGEALLELDADGGRDPVGELVRDGFRVRGAQSIPTEIARWFEDRPA